MAKELVIYFSVYETTEIVAKEIALQRRADIQEIISVIPYDGDRNNYSDLLRVAQKEHDKNLRPRIKEKIPIEDYDTIYIGYPIWCYTFPMIIYTLFDEYDFTGKTIIPFNTHMGSKDGGTYETIKELEPGANVIEGLPVEMSIAEESPKAVVEKWLANLNK